MVSKAGGGLLAFVLKQIDEVDDTSAWQRVHQLRQAHPDWNVDQLAGHLIRRKCKQAAAIGVATAGAGLIPGIGTLAALTVGTVADVNATLKLQTELVLEIAALHGRRLSADEKWRVVALVAGLALGGNRLHAPIARRLSLRLAKQYTQRWLAHALPFAGVAASAGVDAVSTYLVGRRAHAYFGLGPQAVTSWAESLRALSGVDERRLATWLGERTWRTGARLRAAATTARSTLAGMASMAATARRLAARSATTPRLPPDATSDDARTPLHRDPL